MKLCCIGEATVIHGAYPDVGPLLARTFGRESFALVTADPPYGAVAIETQWELNARRARALYFDIIQNVGAHLMPGGSFLLWGGIGRPRKRVLFHAILFAELHGWDMRDFITWKKVRAYGKPADYLRTREELAWFVRTGEEPRTFNVPLLEELRGYPGYNARYPAKSPYKRRSNVWTDITEILRGKRHYAEKPAKLYEVIYSTHSAVGDLVLDICAGSGVAGEVALQLGRKPVLVESDRESFERICGNLRELQRSSDFEPQCRHERSSGKRAARDGGDNATRSRRDSRPGCRGEAASTSR